MKIFKKKKTMKRKFLDGCLVTQKQNLQKMAEQYFENWQILWLLPKMSNEKVNFDFSGFISFQLFQTTHRFSSKSRTDRPKWNPSTTVIIDQNEKLDKLHSKFSNPKMPKTNKNRKLKKKNEWIPQFLEKSSTSPSTIKSPKKLGKNPYDDRPDFNLDTRIEGYDDVDETGKYKKKTDSKIDEKFKNQKIFQEEWNQQWAESLRNNFYLH